MDADQSARPGAGSGLDVALHSVDIRHQQRAGQDLVIPESGRAGISIAALDFEDKGTQIGIGAHLTFFNDFLQVGYRYNLNEISDRRFVFIAIRFFDGTNQLDSLLGARAP